MRLLAGEWAEKLRRYTSLTEHMVKSNPKKASEPDVIMQSEAERVLKLITPQAQQPSSLPDPLHPFYSNHRHTA